jgi:sigma-B regulation protein RsbU (phosphoserine phosphatase)
MSDILVVDDEQAIRHLLSEVLAKDGHRVETAEDGDAALEKIVPVDFDLIVSDLHMKEVDGISVLRAAKNRNPYTEVLILTGRGTVASAVEAMRLGAYEYLTKPIDLQEFRLKVKQVLEHRTMRLQLESQRREIQMHQAMIARDLKLAAQVQMSLVPRPLLNNHFDVAVRYKPMISVGGDFCDIFTDSETATLTMVDVTGHGITAALLVNRMANEIRRLVRDRLEPCVVMHQFNDFICDSFAGTGMFLTMFICRFDWLRGTLTYAGSAHPAAVIWRQSKSIFDKLESQNPIIGFEPAAPERFSQSITKISAGDKMVIYTDGIVEAENGEGQAWGLQGMLEIFRTATYASANHIAETLIQELEKWRPGPLRDDVYLLVAGVK